MILCHTCQVGGAEDIRRDDHRRAGRGGRDDHPTHPVVPDPRPAAPPRAAGTDGALRRPAPGPPVRHPRAPGGRVLPRVAPHPLRGARCRPVARRGPRSRRIPGQGEPIVRSRQRARHGHRRAVRLRPAATLRRGDAGAGRCCRSCPPPCGTRARRPSRPPGGWGGSPEAGRRVLGMVASRAPAPASGASPGPLGRGGAVRGRRRRDHPLRRRVAPALRDAQPRAARGRPARRRGGEPGAGGGRLRRRPRHHGLRPAGPRRRGGARRPGGLRARRRHARRTQSATPTSS